MKAHSLFVVAFAVLASTFTATAQTYEIKNSGVATPKNKAVLLLKNSKGQNDIVLFQTTLRVNTDGSPLSYHPQDPRGKIEALNNVCNAITVKKGNSTDNLCFTSFSEAIGIFEKWRDSNYKTVPDGFIITWKNVLVPVQVDSISVPCVFKTGPYEGYFGSLTALKNDVVGEKGECELKNQIDPLTVPALVLLGGKNVVKDYGVKVGDLLVAFNPETKTVTSGIVGDTGPKENLGEGSIRLNMKLLNNAKPPTNKLETYKLSIEKTKILVAIIPASHLHQIEGNRPYSEENIEKRVKSWQIKAGFSSQEQFLALIKSFQSKLN